MGAISALFSQLWAKQKVPNLSEEEAKKILKEDVEDCETSDS